MKRNFSATQLVQYRLCCLPHTKANIGIRAKKENWPFIEVPGQGGKGGVRREYQVPQYVLDEIVTKEAQKLLNQTASEALPVLAELPATTVQEFLTSKQALVEGARKGVLLAVEQIMALTNISQRAGINAVLVQAKLPENTPLLATLRNAADNRGGAGALPTLRTIQRWFDKRGCNSLAPEVRKADMSVPAWANAFLAEWQKPQKPTVTSAYEQFREKYDGDIPSIHQVRRFLEKLGNVTRQHGRMLPRELKNISVFVRRTYDTLMPTDIYTADGHTFDAEIQHPVHGRPWRPEITTVADVATRRIVGYSIDLAESGLAVLAAVTNAVETNGIPAVFYVDNGSGYKTVLMSDISTGVMGRLSTSMVHSLPYNSQARGVIERLHKTVWVKAAKELPSYMGVDMDKQAKQHVFKNSRKELKQPGTIKSLYIPDFKKFTQFCREKVEEYNNQPHRSLPKVVDIEGNKRHMTPNEVHDMKIQQGAEIVSITPEESSYLFRPQIQRTVLRGEIQFLNNRYFNKMLEEFHGDTVNVAYDINNADFVWVYNDLGVLICMAKFNGNAVDYMPKTFIQAAKDKRAQGREHRLESQLEEVRLEHKGQLVIEHQDSVNISGLNIKVSDLAKKGQEALARIRPIQQKQAAQEVVEHVSAPVDEFSVPDDPFSRFELYLESLERLETGAEMSDKEYRWVTQKYPRTHECKVFSKRAIGT